MLQELFLINSTHPFDFTIFNIHFIITNIKYFVNRNIDGLIKSKSAYGQVLVILALGDFFNNHVI